MRFLLPVPVYRDEDMSEKSDRTGRDRRKNAEGREIRPTASGRESETEEERLAKLRRARKRREKKRRIQRKKQIVRTAKMLLILLIILLAVLGLSAVYKKYKRRKAEEAAKAAAQTDTVEAEDILHLAFLPLRLDDSVTGNESSDTGTTGTTESDTGTDTSDTEESEDTSETTAEDAETEAVLSEDPAALARSDTSVNDPNEEVEYLTASQFNAILEQLYSEGYVLVDFDDIADVNSDGKMEVGNIDIPAGKKPLIISEIGLSYDEDSPDRPSGIRLNDSGEIVNTYQKADGSTAEGAYDVIPCIENFISQHPDFSIDGARGVLGLTGENGILGYDLDAFHKDGSASKLLEELKDRGWRIATCGYAGISYGSSYDIVKADMDQWQSEVEPVIGNVDTIFFLGGSDIGSWARYKESNQKYSYLSELGFCKFCTQDEEEYSWLQATDSYIRQGYHLICTEAEFESVLALDNSSSSSESQTSTEEVQSASTAN